MYRSTLFRAILSASQKSVTEPYANIVMGALRFLKTSYEQRTSFEKLTDPDIYLIEASLSTEDGKAALMDLINSGSCHIRVPKGKLRVRLPVLENDIDVEVGPPRYLGSDDAEWQLNEPCGCVQYLLSSKHPWNDTKISSAGLERLGFANLSQAIWHYVLNPGQETPESPSLDSSAGVLVTLPNYHARISKAVIEGRTIRISVQVPKGVTLADFRLVVRAHGTSKSTGWSVILPPKISDPLRRKLTAFPYAVAPHYATATLYWRLGPDEAIAFVDSMRARRAESAIYPQLATHSLFDPALKFVEESLDSDDAKDFEWAIATLLAIAGFQVDWLGYAGGRIRPEADVIAYLPSQRLVIVGECTLKWADISKKISVLKERTSQLAPILEGWRFKNVIFTNLTKEAILPADREGAKALEIILMPKESLPLMIRAIKSAIPPDLLWFGLQNEGESLMS